MPLPKPSSSEKADKAKGKQKFISRCAGDSSMVKEFPDQKQRLGVLFSMEKFFKA